MTATLVALALSQVPSQTLRALDDQANAMASQVESRLAKDWLAGVSQLPDPQPRTLYRGSSWMTQEQFDSLAPDAKAKVKSLTADAELYYNTKYGTPIAYSRVVDLAAGFGLTNLRGTRVMDFGYGSIGQLRLFARLGATAVGVDVDPFLTALYSRPEDKGPFGGGSVDLVQGQFPADSATSIKVGRDYDLIISKNTLKMGYIHPTRPAKKELLIDLGVSDEVFLGAVHDALKPHGLLVIYNLCPAPAAPDKPFIPWADGRCPFSKAQFGRAGFKIRAFDVNDDAAARKMAHALGWDLGDHPMDTKHDLFGWYTVAQRE